MKTKTNNYLETLKLRHSDYTIAKGSPLTENELIKFIEECIYYHPSAFNVQTTRVVLLLNKNVEMIWDNVLKQLPPNFPQLLVDELTSCKHGYATLLFYDDINATKHAASEYKMALENFESWAIQSAAMLQSVLWNGLSYLGYGVNIQHYNRQIEEWAQKTLNITDHWKLYAQMNIGKITAKTPTRTRLPIEKMLHIKK